VQTIGCNLLKKAYFIFYLNLNRVLRIGLWKYF
jgi:hypothetical protein